jgi:predicted transcriptional regulator
MQTVQIETESELQKQIMDLLETNGPLTRAEMVKKLQTARTTVYDSLVKLMGRKLVDKFPVNNNKRGRPKVFFQICNAS